MEKPEIEADLNSTSVHKKKEKKRDGIESGDRGRPVL
jgi:hypothetical protein